MQRSREDSQRVAVDFSGVRGQLAPPPPDADRSRRGSRSIGRNAPGSLAGRLARFFRRGRAKAPTVTETEPLIDENRNAYGVEPTRD